MEALLIIDVQNDFCEGGALAVAGANSIIEPINNLIEKFKKEGKFIIATKDYHPKEHKSFAINSGGKIGELGELNGIPQVWWPSHCVRGSEGAEFHKELLPVDNVVYKGEDVDVDSYSGFFDNGRKHKTKLDEILKGKNIDTLYVVGLATDYCVKYTVIDGLELGYKVFLVENCIKGVNLSVDDSKNAILEMKDKGAIVI